MPTKKLLILFILIFLLALKFALPQIKIADTSCSLNGQDCPDDLNSIVKGTLGHYFFQIDKKSLFKAIESTGKAENPLINISSKKVEVILSKTLETITINVIFGIENPKFDPETLKEYLATQSATIMSINPKGILENSTQISNYYYLGTQTPSKEILLSIKKWITTLKNNTENSYPTLFTDKEVIYSPIDKLTAIFNISKTPDDQLLLMSKIIDSVKSKGSSVLDFRYNHPILR
jgi:hypothetical protein